jgi:hypothetical protein
MGCATKAIIQDKSAVTPREYLDIICRPSFEEFRAEPSSIRKAWIAAAALYHFADYFEKSRNEEKATIRKRLADAFPKFQQLADIANASKHLELDRGPRTGLAARHFGIGNRAAFSDGTYFSDGTTLSGAREGIRVEFNGDIIDVLWLSEAALAAWEKVAQE